MAWMWLVGSLFVVRVIGALFSPIPDCDESFNFWEASLDTAASVYKPAHFVAHGFGMQTWEYAPQYALRSYSYIVPHSLLAEVGAKAAALFGVTAPKVAGFFFLRILLALTSAYCEANLSCAVENRFGKFAGVATMMLLVFSPGMFFAAPAFLPTTMAMYVVMASFCAYLNDQKVRACAIAAAGGFACGWPFVGAIFIPVGLHAVLDCGPVRTGMAVLVPAAAVAVYSIGIDWIFYGRVVFPALEIVRYNVVGAGGDEGEAVSGELYGTEPWTFYFKNGVLNFNAALPLCLISPLLLCLSSVRRKGSAAFAWVTLASLFVWLAAMQSREHKEERFLYAVYPLICLSAALSVDSMALSLSRLGQHCGITSSTKGGGSWCEALVRLVGVAVCTVGILLSVSRVASQVSGFGAPLALYSRISQHIRPHVELSGQATNRTVCVGGEWYRFPSAYFLPEFARLNFVKSSFGGQLPQPFVVSPDGGSPIPGVYLPSKDRLPGFNNVNREEISRYVDPKTSCDYIIDLDFRESRGDDSVNSEAFWFAKGAELQWKVIDSIPFLDAEQCPTLLRAFYVPYLTPQKCGYGRYVLLERIGKSRGALSLEKPGVTPASSQAKTEL